MSLRHALIGLGLIVTHAIAYWLGGYATFRDVASAGNEHGRFLSAPKTEWVGERDMRLLEDFVYVDPMERPWLAPAGSLINGASIPQLFWSWIGGPFEGSYRNASIVHDVACEKMERPHHEVHRMFYDACLAGGVKKTEALRLFYAVAVFGPRWAFETREVYASTSSPDDVDPGAQQVQVAVPVAVAAPTPADLDELEALFRSDPPTPDEIERLAEATEGTP